MQDPWVSDRSQRAQVRFLATYLPILRESLEDQGDLAKRVKTQLHPAFVRLHERRAEIKTKRLLAAMSATVRDLPNLGLAAKDLSAYFFMTAVRTYQPDLPLRVFNAPRKLPALALTIWNCFKINADQSICPWTDFINRTRLIFSSDNEWQQMPTDTRLRWALAANPIIEFLINTQKHSETPIDAAIQKALDRYEALREDSRVHHSLLPIDQIILGTRLDGVWESNLGLNTLKQPFDIAETVLCDPIWYQPTPYKTAARVLRQMNLDHDSVLMDVGAGLGRIVCVSASAMIKKVYGIEASAELTALGNSNIARLNFAHAPASILNMDAAAIAPEVMDQCNRFILFQPFGSDTEAAFMAQLAASLRRQVRPIIVTYLGKPGKHFTRQPWLEYVHQYQTIGLVLQFIPEIHLPELPK